MKKTIFTTIVLTLMVSVSAFAQKPDVTENFDINGIKIGSVVSASVIRDKIGAPTHIDNSHGEVYYYYGESELCAQPDILVSAIVYNRDLPVMTYIFDGGIRVGDNASEVKAKIRQKTRNEIHETDKGFIAGSYDYHVSFGVSNGKITSISFHLESI